MDEKKIDQTTKEIEKHLEELIKVKMMRVVSAKLDSKKFTNKWKPILNMLETIHPGSLKKLQKIVKESLDKADSSTSKSKRVEK